MGFGPVRIIWAKCECECTLSPSVPLSLSVCLLFSFCSLCLFLLFHLGFCLTCLCFIRFWSGLLFECFVFLDFLVFPSACLLISWCLPCFLIILIFVQACFLFLHLPVWSLHLGPFWCNPDTLHFFAAVGTFIRQLIT